MCKPVMEGFIARAQSEKVTAEDKMVKGATERYIDDRSWLYFNSHLPEIIKVPTLHYSLAEVLDKRLKEKNDPYTKEMLYLTRGVIKS